MFKLTPTWPNFDFGQLCMWIGANNEWPDTTSYRLDEWFWAMFEPTPIWPDFIFGQLYIWMWANNEQIWLPICQMSFGKFMPIINGGVIRQTGLLSDLSYLEKWHLEISQKSLQSISTLKLPPYMKNEPNFTFPTFMNDLLDDSTKSTLLKFIATFLRKLHTKKKSYHAVFENKSTF